MLAIAWRDHGRLRLLIFAGLACAVLVPFSAAGASSGLTLNPRYMLPGLPFLVLGMSLGLARLTLVETDKKVIASLRKRIETLRVKAIVALKANKIAKAYDLLDDAATDLGHLEDKFYAATKKGNNLAKKLREEGWGGGFRN